MLNHLKSAKKVFREENNYFAATMFKDIPNICVSCHNQDKIEKGFTMDTQRLDFDSDYEYAEYNYMARNYNKALKYFDLSLKGEGSALSEKDVYPSLRKTLTIYTQIEKDPHHAISYFEKFLVRKDIPLMVRNDIRDWISGLQDWDKHDDLKIKKLNWANLKPLVEKYLVPMSKGGAFNLDGKQQITYLRLAGLLYDYLQDGPNVKDTPEVLYWLAVCDRMLNYDYFFSLADLYLKECITSFSKSEIAPKCYQEYKEYINYAFTGSGIQEIPQDIQLELKTLKKKLKGHLIKK